MLQKEKPKKNDNSQQKYSGTQGGSKRIKLPASLEKCDLPFLVEVLLISDEDNDNGRTGEGAGVGQPVGQIVEGLP